MTYDVFVSYARTSDKHREWVHLLASQLHLLGYNIALDQNVDYGNSLNGFMRKAVDSRRVLMIVDENYVYRADNRPETGVGIENAAIRPVYHQREETWLATLFVNNPSFRLPAWLTEHNPKGFDFNANIEEDSFPGAAQLNDLWRWAEGLPTDDSHEVPLATLRERARRMEEIDRLRDPATWKRPSLSETVTFPYRNQTSGTLRVGHGEHEFAVCVAGHSDNSVFVVADSLKAVGLVQREVAETAELAEFLTPGRLVTAQVGQHVVLMNHHGSLCTLQIDEVQDEVNSAAEYIAPYVTFTYQIHLDS